MSLFRVAPFYYIHVLDNNTNVTRLVVGPQTFALQDHEKLVLMPTKMLVIPPEHYCIIGNPTTKTADGSVEVDKYNQVKLQHGDIELRFNDAWSQPFPLYPGEELQGAVDPMEVVPHDTALRLRVKRDFDDADADVSRVAGDEFHFHGPGTFKPRMEVEIGETVVASIILENHGLKLRSRQGFTDNGGVERQAGEEWLVRTSGAYLPHVDEIVVSIVKPTVLPDDSALHLRATDTFTDVYGQQRNAGEEWLVTRERCELHLCDVYERIIGGVGLTVLNKLQYCIVLDPVDATGKNRYGSRELRQGDTHTSFFLQPGETLEAGIQDAYVLGCQQALLLKAVETFVDGGGDNATERQAGDLWMVHGPCFFVPSVELEVVEKREAIPLDDNEGIYVRNNQTGHVRAVTGQTYMLKSCEELWEKPLAEEVSELLAFDYGAQDTSGASDNDYETQRVATKRDRTRVVTYRVPHNAVVQVYDYKRKAARMIFGPDLVLLQPDEQFTVLSLSGDKPKRPNVIKSLALMLGPDFMSDVIQVETSDHARLRMKLSYNWQFIHDTPEDKAKLFQVRDHIGDACKAIASRIRAAAAAETFDRFHKMSAKLIRIAVFGVDEHGKVGDQFIFNANNLAITNIDIQSVEPVDERTHESLQKSVQLAIEIATKKQERNARHSAEVIEQTARGKIEEQRLKTQADIETCRQSLTHLLAKSAAVSSTGTATAEAHAKAEYLEIQAQADLKVAEMTAQAMTIAATASLTDMKKTQQLEIDHERNMDELDISKNQALADIEAKKFRDIVAAITPKALQEIARAGPEFQVRLLKGLGLKGYLMTDGSAPINLFSAAKGMTAPNMQSMAAASGAAGASSS